MKKTVSNRGIRRVYWAVSVCFLVLAAWLYCKESPYVKVMDISIAPEGGRIQAEVAADGKNIRVWTGDQDVELFVEERPEGDLTRLLIHGECDEDRSAPVDIKIASDTDNWQKGWTRKISAGTLQGDISLTGGPNHYTRLAYVAMSLVTVCLFGFMWFGRKGDTEELERYSSRVIEKLSREPGMEPCCREGKRLSAAYEMQLMLMLMMILWTWVFWTFRLMHAVLRGGMYRVFSGSPGEVIAVYFLILVMMYGGLIRWGNLTNGILTRDCRPVTAAVAYLLMGRCRIIKRRGRFPLYHNGAAGLYRSGHCREALEVSDMAWSMPGRKPREYNAYVHSSLRCQCLKALEEGDAAREEERRMEALLAKNPVWGKRKAVRRVLGIQDICRQIENGEMEQAEKRAGEILGQWREGYYRLPVLGLMAELKEFLGKEEEAAGLREEILTFSPENKEVRQVMGEGRLSYREKKAKAWDLGLAAICGICLCITLANVFTM